MASITADDRQAATDIVLRFFHLVDKGQAGQTAALFTADGRITFGPGSPKPGTIAGEAIAPAMLARQGQTHVTTRHVISNIIVSSLAGGGIAVSSLLTLFRSEDEGRDTQPASVADIDDVLVRDGAGWRIRERTILPIFNRA